MLPVSDTAMVPTILAIQSGLVDATMVLEHLGQHISKVKEEALSQHISLLPACDEESWLKEYNNVRDLRVTKFVTFSDIVHSFGR